MIILGIIVVGMTIEYVREGQNNWQYLGEYVDLDDAVAAAKQFKNDPLGMQLSAVRIVSKKDGSLLWMNGRHP
jgi:hypothetical protein